MTAPVPPQLPGLMFTRQLGSGGYSDVYLYEQQVPRREVAVKVLRVAGLTEALRRRFTTEADTMASLAGHPNIVPVFSADLAADGRPYLTMLFCPRQNLAERAATATFGVSETLRIGVQIGGAVETAHRANVLHRDIKPANILTDRYGIPRLADFGIAGEIAAGDDDPELGVSVHFAPPEVLYATAPPSVASDVYSLGATLWTLLTGRPPFSVPGRDGTAELMERVRSTAPRATGRADVPASLDRLLAQTLSKNPAVRPRRAIDLVRALQQIEQEQHLPVTQESVETVEPEHRAPTVTGNETRMRAPRVTGPVSTPPPSRAASGNWAPAAATPPAPPSSPPAQPAGDPATVRRAATVREPAAARERVLPHQGPAAQTVHRAAPVSDAPEVASGRRGVRRPVAIVLGLLAVAAIVVLGVTLLGSGSGGSTDVPTTPSTVSDPGDQDPVGVGPGPVTVTATRVDPNTVRFAWTYTGSEAGDSFAWQVTDGSDTGKTSQPSVDLPVATGVQTCVEVKVYRSDGTDAPVSWSTPGCSS